MGGFNPEEEISSVEPIEQNEEEGLMTKLGKAARKKIAGPIAAIGLGLASEASASDPAEVYQKNLAAEADRAQANLEKTLAEEKEIKNQVDAYKAKVRKYYPQHAELMIKYFEDTITEPDGRPRSMDLIKVVVESYTKELDKNIAKDFGPKTTKKKAPKK